MCNEQPLSMQLYGKSGAPSPQSLQEQQPVPVQLVRQPQQAQQQQQPVAANPNFAASVDGTPQRQQVPQQPVPRGNGDPNVDQSTSSQFTFKSLLGHIMHLHEHG
jgi:hypothetical protein